MHCQHCQHEVDHTDVIYCHKCESPHHVYCWNVYEKECGNCFCKQTEMVMHHVRELVGQKNYCAAIHFFAKHMKYVVTLDPDEVLYQLQQEQLESFKEMAREEAKLVVEELRQEESEKFKNNLCCTVFVIAACAFYVGFIYYFLSQTI